MGKIITLTIEVDRDLSELNDQEIEELHLSMVVQGEDLFGVVSSRLDFNGEVVASIASPKDLEG